MCPARGSWGLQRRESETLKELKCEEGEKDGEGREEEVPLSIVRESLLGFFQRLHLLFFHSLPAGLFGF